MTLLSLIFYLFREHRWFNGRMLACHAGGPGSIPGRCIFIFILNGFFTNSFLVIFINVKICHNSKFFTYDKNKQ